MIEETITAINTYLKKELWMDFELFETKSLDVVLSGKIDNYSNEKIRITFKEPYMVSSTYYFTYEGCGDFIEILTGKDAYVINMQYNVTQGNYIFKFKNTQLNGLMYVIAKDITVDIT